MKKPPNIYLKTLPAPFEFTPEKEMSNTSIFLPYSLKNTLKHLCPARGVIQQTVQILLKAIVDNLTQNKYNHYSLESESYFVELLKATARFIKNYEPEQ